MQAALGPHHSPTSMEGKRISLLMLFVLAAAHLPSMEAVQGGRDQGAGSQAFISSVRSSNSHPDLLVITNTTTTPLFQITPVLNTGLSLSEPLQLYKGYNAI